MHIRLVVNCKKRTYVVWVRFVQERNYNGKNAVAAVPESDVLNLICSITSYQTNYQFIIDISLERQ
jgi:hypothetical protein